VAVRVIMAVAEGEGQRRGREKERNNGTMNKASISIISLHHV